MKIDYPKLQRLFWDRCAANPSLTVQEFCAEQGINYATARRYIKKQNGRMRKATGLPKVKSEPNNRGTDWNLILKEYLVRATQNPSLSMNAYAKEKGINSGTLRRTFKEMRSDARFDPLFDLFDRQIAQFRAAKKRKGTKSLEKTEGTVAGSIAHQQIDPFRSSSKSVKSARELLANAPYKSAELGTPVVHGGYSRSVGLINEMMDAIMQIDPLSVANELVMARAQYYRMQTSLSKRLSEIDQREEDGDIPIDDEGNPVSLDKLRDTLIFGYAPRLRELEFSISSMVKNEQKRYLELRKLELEELSKPHLLPSEETQIVIEILQLRNKNKWSAIETVQQIELMGATPPALLMHEAKLELAAIEPEVDDSGVTPEELDAQFDSYEAEQSSYGDDWLANRREEVAIRLQEAEDRENGVEPTLSAKDIQKAAQTEQEYDELAEREGKRPNVFDDIDSFEVL